MKTQSFLSSCLSISVLLAVCSLAAPVAGGPTLDCQCVSLIDPDDHHFFTPGGDRAYKCDSPGCHTTGVDQLCSSEHEGCGSGLAEALDIEEAMQTGSSAVAFAAGDNVVYNPHRQALQVVACNGSIIASVYVPDAYVLAVIEASMLKYA